MEKIETICIIDDDEIYQLFTKKSILRINDRYEILSYINGRDAMQGLQQRLDAKSEMPDLILLDINMPVMDGWQFMESFLAVLPQIDKKITIYIVSSSIAPSDKEKAHSYASIAGFISKPLDVETLQKLLQLNTVQ